jgi:hypothetical protein
VPHPHKSLAEPLLLDRAPASGVPTTYILTVEAGAETDSFSRHADRARARGWTVLRMTAGHNPQTTAPRELSELLHGLR